MQKIVIGITIEPIMKFDLIEFSKMIIEIKPKFVNIGADSKGHNLPEPTKAEVYELIKVLKNSGIDVREKHNLERLK